MAGRLRIPKALAVALLGSTTTVAVSFAGCDVPQQKMPPGNPDDPSAIVPDGSTVDGSEVDTPDGYIADVMIDARPDAAIDARPDAAIDARPDAPPDARPDAPIV